MKLYISPGACSRAPHIVLLELGLDHSVESVDLRARPQVLRKTGAPYAEINPKGAVPALKLEQGELLTENSVILQYLADQKPEAGLLAKPGSMERYRAMEWLSYVGSDVHKILGQLFNPLMPEEGKLALKQVADRRLTYLDQHLSTRPYLMGDKFSVADTYLWVILGWTAPLKVDMTPYPNLRAYQDRIASRPSVLQMLEAEAKA